MYLCISVQRVSVTILSRARDSLLLRFTGYRQCDERFPLFFRYYYFFFFFSIHSPVDMKNIRTDRQTLSLILLHFFFFILSVALAFFLCILFSFFLFRALNTKITLRIKCFIYKPKFSFSPWEDWMKIDFFFTGKSTLVISFSFYPSHPPKFSRSAWFFPYTLSQSWRFVCESALSLAIEHILHVTFLFYLLSRRHETTHITTLFFFFFSFENLSNGF